MEKSFAIFTNISEENRGYASNYMRKSFLIMLTNGGILLLKKKKKKKKKNG